MLGEQSRPVAAVAEPGAVAPSGTGMFGIDERALQIVWTVFLFALSLAVVYYIRSTLLLFAAAVFFAYMLWPVVGLIERFIPRRRTLALTLVYIVLVGLLVLLGFQLVPTIAGEATSLVKTLPSRVTGGSLSKMPLPAFLDPMRDQVIGFLNKGATNLESSVVPFLQHAGTRVLSGLGELLPAILVPILAFFFLKDGRSICEALLGAVKDRRDRSTARLILDDVHNVLRNYIRALVFLALSAFTAWSLFLTVLRLPYEFLLAGIAAVLEFIPVIGPAAALAIMLIVFMVTNAGNFLWIIIFWACLRIFQDYVLAPYLMSSGIELHPLLVLFGVLAGEQIGGVAGMFFSVPAIAILRVVFNHLKTSYKGRQSSRPLPTAQVGTSY